MVNVAQISRVGVLIIATVLLPSFFPRTVGEATIEFESIKLRKINHVSIKQRNFLCVVIPCSRTDLAE